MFKNKSLAIVLTTAGVAALALASIAGAQTTFTASSAPDANQHASPAPKMSLEIGPAGRALLRGTLVSVGSGSIVVKSWGGNWNVNVPQGAEVLPRVTGNSSDISSFAVGDQIGVNGTAASDAVWTINARIVRDSTARKTENQNRKEIRNVEKSGRQAGAGKVFEGVASNVASDSFSLAARGENYTVHVSSATNVVNRNFLKIGLNSIQNGDKVRVFGSASSTDITAQVVRDASLPAKPVR